MFIDWALRKRALIVFFALAILFCGFKAYLHLPLEAYPDVANMQVRIITKVPGKAAEEVERNVTIPIEKELNGIPKAEPPRSASIFGLSVITVVFDDGVPSNVARQQVLEKIAQADLPPGIAPELDPDASPAGEVYRYTVDSKTWNSMDRKQWQDWVLVRKFKSIPGIVDVTSFGGPTKTYQIELDPARMRALNISQDDVEKALDRSNGSTGGSYIVRNDQDFMVRGLGLLRSKDDVENVVIAASSDGSPVLVKDIAEVEITPAVRVGQVGQGNDDDVVEGILLMRRGENPSRAVANIKDAWNDVASALPAGMHLTPLYDRTALVSRTVNTIGHSVAEGIVLVVVMLVLFLFQVRSAFICATVIPLALSIAFILLNCFSVPGNLLSLGAIDFGIIVDGAIVMVENIVRLLSKLPQGSPARDVVSTIGKAAREVAKPILFATTIIIVTFLPILTLESVEGKLFRPLAVTMNFNLIAAVVASLTVIPVLCTIVFLLRPPKERHSPIVTWAKRVYKPLLETCMSRSRLVGLVALAIVFTSLPLAPLLGSEFIPELEEGNIWLRVTVLPTSVSLDRSVSLAREIRQILSRFPEVKTAVTQIGASDDGTDPNGYSNIEVFIDLKPQEEWPSGLSKQELVARMNSQLQETLPGLLYNFSQYIKDNMDEAIAGVKGELAIKIFGPDLVQLTRLGREVKHQVEQVPGMVDIAADELLGQPQIVVDLDRARASRYGVNTQDVLDVIETSVGGKAVTNVYEGERKFAVVLRYAKGFRADSEQIRDILVKTPRGSSVPLAQLCKIDEAPGASSITREKNERRLAVKANIRGRDLCSAVNDARARVDKYVKIPEGYHMVWGGQFERAQHAGARLAMIIPVTLLLVFMLLYAATGEARIAALVMLVVPLSIPGGLLALLLTHTHFSISAGVGFIALSGVSVQNGVILVSLVSELVKQGKTLKQAVFDSAMVRMQPALMTTCVAMAGLIPAAVATGIGSQSQKPFAIVIAGGLMPAILLSLLVLPAMYPVFYNAFRPKGEMEKQPMPVTD